MWAWLSTNPGCMLQPGYSNEAVSVRTIEPVAQGKTARIRPRSTCISANILAAQTDRVDGVEVILFAQELLF